MKNKLILPFALTALFAALSGCGGESANVIPEKYDESTENGSCKSNSENCVEFVLDYPVDGINFLCSSDSKNRFVTLFDDKEGVSTGACKLGDTVTFSIRGENDKEIKLGSVKLSTLSNVASSTSPPRLTLLDIAAGITGTPASSLNPNDETVKVAMRLVKVIQAIGLKNNRITSPTDIQSVLITDNDRKGIDSISKSLETNDFKTAAHSDDEFNALFTPWLKLADISNADAFTVVQKLMNISTAAVFQPEFALFSTAEQAISAISGSNGLVGCDKDVCELTDKEKINLFGHFMLMTDRQGMTFGSGLQWRGKVDKNLSTIGTTNMQLLTQVRPVRMTATAQDNWIDPLTKSIDKNRNLGFKFDVDQTGSDPLIVRKGTLLADKMVIGTAGNLYKTLMGLSETYTPTEIDKERLGAWDQTISGTKYKGTLDLYKLYPVSYLDKSVFKSINNVATGENYIFPLYADLSFKFTDTSIKSVKLGVVIDRNGDIRTNIPEGVAANALTKPLADVDLSTSADGCNSTNADGDVLDKFLMKDQKQVQQYRIGTVSRTFTKIGGVNPNTISIRMILADQFFGILDGALIGMNSSVKTSDNTSMTVGGALVQLEKLVAADAGTRPAISLTDSDNQKVKWANSLASFTNVYSKQNDSDAEAKEIAKLSGGEISISLAQCYSVKKK